MDEYFQKLAANTFKEMAIGAFDWVMSILPDICGYGAMLTGVLIFLNGMAGRGITKTLGAYAGLLIFSVCALGGV